MEYNFSEDLKSIREILGFSQSELAEKIGVEQVTISRTELKKTEPSARLLEAVYSFAFDKNIKINKLKEMFWRDDLGANEKLLFHGAKTEIDGEIDIHKGRKNNDFGQGFYTGESYEQAISFVSGFGNSSVYYIRFDDRDLKCKRYEVNQEWMMTIAYYRGTLDEYKDHPAVKALIEQSRNCDYIIAPIADNRMFQIINSFIEGELTDEWVAKNTDYTTVDDYRESIRSELEKNAKESAQEVLKNTAWSTVLENSEVKEYPQEDVDKAVSEFKKSMEVYAKQADMTLEEFTDSQGISQDDFDEQCQQYAEGKVKQNLIVQGIMDAEGLSLDDKESLQLQDKLVEQMGVSSIAELVGTYGQDYVDESVGLLRVEEFIIKNASVSEKVANGDVLADDADAAAENAEQDSDKNVSDEDTDDSGQDNSDVDENLEEELGTEDVDQSE